MDKYSGASMAEVFFNRAKTYGEKPCVAYKNDSGRYHEITWSEMNDKVRALGKFLIAMGIAPGDRVAVFSPNRYEWWITDLAILSVGAVNVPVYPTNSSEEAAYVLSHSGCRICFAAGKDHLEKILQVKKSLPDLSEIIIFDDKDHVSDFLGFQDALKKGSEVSVDGEIESRLTGIKPDDLATIIYTSGTTGNPKGVMLSHNNFISNVKQIYHSVGPDIFSLDDNVWLSFLPLSHVLERTVGYYLPLYLGHKVVFSEGFDKIVNNLREVRPTLIVSVPRLYEKMHAGLIAKVSSLPHEQKKAFEWALDTARKNVPYVCGNRIREGEFEERYAEADKLVLSKVKKDLGLDRLRIAFAGGAPLSMADAEFILGMDIRLVEGYGLTETTPCINANNINKIKPGAVGATTIDTEEKLGEGGEVLVKGPQVMLGYYRDEAATHEAFTEDGFFRTGDIGEFDEDGYLRIIGRIKDIIITSGGKNISPQNIENSLKESPLIEQVAVIGDNKKYLSALVIPVYAELEAWAKEKGLPFQNRRDLVENPIVLDLLEKEILAYTKQYSKAERIKKFRLLEHDWSQATGELTPTLKVKRRVINKKYAREIDSMYANS